MRESKETKCKKADALKIVCDVCTHTQSISNCFSNNYNSSKEVKRDKRELGETHVDLLSREDQRKQEKKKDRFPNENYKMIVCWFFVFYFLRNVCCWELLGPVFIDFISRWGEGYGWSSPNTTYFGSERVSYCSVFVGVLLCRRRRDRILRWRKSAKAQYLPKESK